MATETAPRVWKLTFAQIAGTPSISFSAYLTGYEKGIPVDDKMTATISLKCTGAPTYA